MKTTAVKNPKPKIERKPWHFLGLELRKPTPKGIILFSFLIGATLWLQGLFFLLLALVQIAIHTGIFNQPTLGRKIWGFTVWVFFSQLFFVAAYLLMFGGKGLS